MASNEDVREDVYDVDDGSAAYEGMDAYVGDEDGGNHETIYGIQVYDDTDDEDYVDEEQDDDEDEEFYPEANDGEFIDDGVDEPDGLDTIYFDASQSTSGRFGALLQNIITAQADASSAGIDSDGAATNAFNHVLQLLRTRATPNTGIGRIVNIRSRSDASDQSSATEGDTGPSNAAERRKWVQTWWKKPHSEPQPAGVALLKGGEFGRMGRRAYMQLDGNRSFSRILRERSRSIHPMPKQDLCEFMVPNSAGAEVASYPSSVYCGQYSADSSFYYVCCKDFNLHIYDTTAPREPDTYQGHVYYDSHMNHKTTMKVHKSIQGIPEGWTITDSHLSPDNDRLIYSSMSPTVYMVIAGGRGKIFVYDLLGNRRTVKISAHQDDVNSCCWADQGSNVLISASDDTFIKVWDRRSLGSSPRPSGVLIGHTEGITNVSAKGDGRYVISNGKDQAIRLWDLRKMASDAEYRAVSNKHYGLKDFDYRYADNRHQKLPAHPKDCSVMTYRGHTVMRTLIRCHFSPAETTGSRYIYSGSLDGRIHIWSLDGRLVQVLDRSETLPMSFDPSGPDVPSLGRPSNGSCVRDVSWHTREPVMLSAAWGVHGTSSVARHEWKGLNKMGGSLEDWEEKRVAEEAERISGRSVPLRRSMRLSSVLPGAYHFDDDDDDNEYFTEDE
ncbi:WD40 repeat-like protein [Sanghuangporus baumii]|uniref:WD40 repeat-like protein n=1 Tax=Sanghuangporus baumii TaxID=108892 RepID=A0A9Q5HWG2_SANBA|nr:WD40 repeat-like protein [Sanghuangporus baumii]